MSLFESPFLALHARNWLCSNDLAFAIFDGFPISPGHVLVTTRRMVETWFGASDGKQAGRHWFKREGDRVLAAFPCQDKLRPDFEAMTSELVDWAVEPVAVATPLRVVGASPDTGESEERENRDLPGFVEAPAAKEKFTRLVPVYSLEAAAGLWGPETAPEEIGWAEPAGTSIKPGMFIARVRGHRK